MRDAFEQNFGATGTFHFETQQVSLLVLLSFKKFLSGLHRICTGHRAELPDLFVGGCGSSTTKLGFRSTFSR